MVSPARSSAARRYFLTGLVSLTTLLSVRADDVYWLDGTGDWNIAENWSTGAIPTIEDTAVVEGGTAIISDGTGFFSHLLVGFTGGSVGTLNVSGVNSSVSGGYVLIGYEANTSGTMNVDGGLISTEFSNIGNAAGSIGVVTMTGGTWQNSLEFRVGASGSGTLQLDGGLIVNPIGHIGRNAGSTGMATVTGGTWQSTGELRIGYLGTGTLRAEGGIVSSNGGSIGSEASGVGNATVAGGTWQNSGGLIVGGAGQATLAISDQGSVTVGAGATIGSASSSNTVTVSGQDSQWIIAEGLVVGAGGSNNSITIEDSALVKVGSDLGDTISFSTAGGTTNVLRLDGGYIALFGNQTTYVSGTLLTNNLIQRWDGSAWITATLSDLTITYFAGTPEGASAALTATGYDNLGGYTVVTAVPEPSVFALAVLGLAGIVFVRRLGKTV